MFFLIFGGKIMTILQEKSLKIDKYIVILASLLVLNKNERLIWIVSKFLHISYVDKYIRILPMKSPFFLFLCLGYKKIRKNCSSDACGLFFVIRFGLVIV